MAAQLTSIQKWLLSVAPAAGEKIFEGLCIPGRANGRGLRAVLTSLERRGLVSVSRKRYCTTFARTNAGHSEALRIAVECWDRDTTEFECAKRNRNERTRR